MTNPKQSLDRIFDAERSLRAAEAELLQTPRAQLGALLADAVDAALAEGTGADPGLRLERLADLCAQVEGPEMADALIRILDCDTPRVRVQAAEALVDVAFERYAEVARAVERALAAGRASQALQELPWVIAEVAEPSAVRLIAGFLAHSDPQVVASAIEALASLGDPQALPLLAALKGDSRRVELDEYDGEVSGSVGELAEEAMAALADQ